MPNFFDENLPDDVLGEIISHLDDKDLISLLSTNKKLDKRILMEPVTWKDRDNKSYIFLFKSLLRCLQFDEFKAEDIQKLYTAINFSEQNFECLWNNSLLLLPLTVKAALAGKLNGTKSSEFKTSLYQLQLGGKPFQQQLTLMFIRLTRILNPNLENLALQNLNRYLPPPISKSGYYYPERKLKFLIDCDKAEADYYLTQLFAQLPSHKTEDVSSNFLSKALNFFHGFTYQAPTRFLSENINEWILIFNACAYLSSYLSPQQKRLITELLGDFIVQHENDEILLKRLLFSCDVLANNILAPRLKFILDQYLIILFNPKIQEISGESLRHLLKILIEKNPSLLTEYTDKIKTALLKELKDPFRWDLHERKEDRYKKIELLSSLLSTLIPKLNSAQIKSIIDEIAKFIPTEIIRAQIATKNLNLSHDLINLFDLNIQAFLSLNTVHTNLAAHINDLVDNINDTNAIDNLLEISHGLRFLSKEKILKVLNFAIISLQKEQTTNFHRYESHLQPLFQFLINKTQLLTKKQQEFIIPKLYYYGIAQHFDKLGLCCVLLFEMNEKLSEKQCATIISRFQKFELDNNSLSEGISLGFARFIQFCTEPQRALLASIFSKVAQTAPGDIQKLGTQGLILLASLYPDKFNDQVKSLAENRTNPCFNIFNAFLNTPTSTESAAAAQTQQQSSTSSQAGKKR